MNPGSCGMEDKEVRLGGWLELGGTPTAVVVILAISS